MATTTQARARDAGARTMALLRTSGPPAVLAAALAFFGWTALTAIAHPGPQYDELLFVNAALGGHFAGGTFVTDRVLDVPTMLMPYVGALKSWLYAPLFGLFGVSMTTIRVPAVLVSGATICVAFLLARRLFGAWPAALLAVLLATDATFVVMSKTDYGPVVLSAFLRVAALAAYFAWTRTGSVRYAVLLGASVALGIFNKVDFLAFVGALALAALVVDHRTIVRRVRERPRALVLTTAALVAVLLVEYVEIYRPARDFPAAKSGAGLSGRLDEVWTLFRATMDGTGFYAYMTGEFLDVRTWIAPVVVAVVVLAGVLTLWRLSPRGRRPDPADAPLADTARTTGFLLLLLLTIFAALAATPQAVGPHHAMLMWPLPALLAVALVRAATQLRAPALRVGVTAVLTVGLLGLAGSQIRVADAYRSAFDSDRAWPPIWTTEAYPLATAVKRVAPGVDTIVVADWGIGNQLLALGDDDVRRRINDAWGTFAGGSRPAIDQLSLAALHGHRALVLMHRPGAEVMPETTARAKAMIERLHPTRPVEVLYRGQALLAYLVDDRGSG